jgi:hypothetical protein
VQQCASWCGVGFGPEVEGRAMTLILHEGA